MKTPLPPLRWYPHAFLPALTVQYTSLTRPSACFREKVIIGFTKRKLKISVFLHYLHFIHPDTLHSFARQQKPVFTGSRAVRQLRRISSKYGVYLLATARKDRTTEWRFVCSACKINQSTGTRPKLRPICLVSYLGNSESQVKEESEVLVLSVDNKTAKR